MTAKDAVIEGDVTINKGSIKIGGTPEIPNFEVTNEGKMIAKDAVITDGDVTITQGSIKIGGTEAEPNFEVNSYGELIAKKATITGNITVTEGEITIGQDFPVIYAYIVDGATPLTQGWLSLTDGGSALTPDVNNVYLILSDGEYAFKRYKWNNVNYESYVKQFFHVDNQGNVTIGSGSININDLFEVDQNGNVTIRSGSITIGNNFEVSELGHLIARSGVIGGCEIDEYGNLKIPSANIEGLLSADRIYGGSITASEIELGQDFPVIDAFIRTGYTEFSVNWLTTTSGDPISPSTNNVYRVMTDGDHFYSKFKWDGSTYEPYTRRYFHVDDQGNVEIGGGSITIGNNFEVDSLGNVTIRSGSMDIGNGKFQVQPDGTVIAEAFRLNSGGVGTNVSIDTEGKLRAENAEIMGTVITDDMHVTKVIFSDTVEMEMASESQTLSYSYTASGTHPISQPMPGGYLRVVFGLNVSSPLKQAKTFTVTISYNNGFTGAYYEVSHSITIPKDSTQGSSFVDLWNDDNNVINIRRKSVFPSQFVQYETTGFTALGIDSNLIVTGNVLPKTNDMYDIGASDKKWDDIYATNGTIQTSDLRNKKEVNYDISVYNGLFDKLKPASYKFNDGSRTHLGFIAQDLRDSLVEQGINTQDFAGFIKALKFNSREKAPEDLTEDDYVYGIRYSELHAMEVRQIQLLKDYIQKLEARIAALESKEGS